MIQGKGVLKTDSEVTDIHKENMEKIARMTHEERIKEKQTLLATLKPEHIQFFRNLRKHKPEEENKAQIPLDSPYSQVTQKLSSEKMFAQGEEHNSLKSGDIEMQALQESEMEVENTKLVSGSVKTEEKSGLGKLLTDETRQCSGYNEASLSSNDKVQPSENKNYNPEISEKELPILPSEANQWLHMDKVRQNFCWWHRMFTC